MDQTLDQVDGAVGNANDVPVYARSDAEHDQVLHNLMKVAAKNGLVFNSWKCTIKTDYITFFGMTHTAEGVKRDPAKIKDLLDMPQPTSKKEVQEFLGFITYLGPFIPKRLKRQLLC